MLRNDTGAIRSSAIAICGPLAEHW